MWHILRSLKETYYASFCKLNVGYKDVCKLFFILHIYTHIYIYTCKLFIILNVSYISINSCFKKIKQNISRPFFFTGKQLNNNILYHVLPSDVNTEILSFLCFFSTEVQPNVCKFHYFSVLVLFFCKV